MSNDLDINLVLAELSRMRQVFHSEADLQFAFSWVAKTIFPRYEVRLESHPTRYESLDLALIDPVTQAGIAVEFKYKTRLWSGTCNDEYFALKSHGASDIGSYDIVKDITRVERFIHGRDGWRGYVIVISNDPSYWNLPTHGRETNAQEFRVAHGVKLSGIRQWGPKTGGTKKGRENSLELAGNYVLEWADYSMLDTHSAGKFKSLVISIV